MAITARFRVSRITDGTAGQGTSEVELTPDYAQGSNAEWAASTPYGVIRLGVANEAAIAAFRANEHGPVHVLFEFPD